MDSQDSSAAPPPHQPHHHHHHQQQLQRPPQMSVGPPQQHLHQQPPNSYSFQQQQLQQQQPRFPFSSIVTSSPQQLKMSMDHYPDGGGGGGVGGNTSSPNNGGGGGASSGFGIDSSAHNKKKRGRPRKISPDGAGNNISLGLSPALTDSGAAGTDAFSLDAPAKKHRGRPPGSGKKQQLDALGTIGIGFTPHVITVNAGEDISSKVMDFSQQGPRTVCILSANGSISSVTLRQPSSSSGTVTYEGKFEIVSMSGSFLVSDNSGTRNRTGGLCVSLAGTDGRVLGGGVAGVLKAASPVQIVVGSFIQDEKKPKSSVPAAAAAMTQPAPNMFSFGNPVGAEDASPPSHGGGGSSDDASDDDDDDGGGGSPTDDGGAYGDNGGEPPMQNVHMYSSMGWGNSPMKMHHQQHHHHPN